MTFLITKENSILFPFKDHSYPVYKTDKGLNKKALIRLFTLIEKYKSHYSKSAIFRIDLHPDSYTSDNKIISSFLAKQIKLLEKKYSCIVSYFFAREQNSSDKQHYHLALFFSGHKVNHPSVISNEIKNNWKSHCAGSIHFVENPMYTIKRGDKRSIDQAIYRLSYLIKNYTKEKNGKGQSYGLSRLKYKGEMHESDFLFVIPEVTYRNFKKYKMGSKS
ncbi:YagK/YfjJ domain-containing protein [Thalassotalea agariperforans]